MGFAGGEYSNISTSMISLSGSSSTGIPVPLKRYIPREGGRGGVEGGGSSGLTSPSRSLSLSEQSDGVGASTVDGGLQFREAATGLDEGGCEVDKEVELEGRKELEVEVEAKLESDDDGRERRLAVGPKRKQLHQSTRTSEKNDNLRGSSRKPPESRHLFLFSPIWASIPAGREADKELEYLFRTVEARAKFVGLRLGVVKLSLRGILVADDGPATLSPDADRPETFRRRTVFISVRKAAILSGAIPMDGCPCRRLGGLIGASEGVGACLRAARADANKASGSPDDVGKRRIVLLGRGGGGGGAGGGGGMKSGVEDSAADLRESYNKNQRGKETSRLS